MKQRVSVIIPTYNAESHLEPLMFRLRMQSIRNIEIVVIDSSSTDETLRIAEKYSDLVIQIQKQEFDHGKTRNIAGQKSHGDILIYLTQDALPYDKNTIKNIVNAFTSDTIGAAYGKQIPYSYTNAFGKHLRHFNYTDSLTVKSKQNIKNLGIKTAFISNSFAAYRRKSLESVGWFKNGLIFGEDMHVGAKMILNGWKLVYTPKAVVYHSHSYTFLQELKRYFDIGVFHSQEQWILEKFGNTGREGVKYLRSEIEYLLKNNLWYLIPESLSRNILKYLGYKVGQHYHLLPDSARKLFSMNKGWWKGES